MENEIKSPVKAIRAYCKVCKKNSYKAIAECKDTNCSLYAFRFGKNPFIAKREMTPEQRQAAAERLRRAVNKITD